MIKINDLLGAPYRDHGRDISGFDCYGLVIEAARRDGKKVNDVFYENHDIELFDENAPTVNITPLEKPCAGAVLEMECNGELHLGYCLNEREFIHMTRAGCRVSRIGIIKIRGVYGLNSLL